MSSAPLVSTSMCVRDCAGSASTRSTRSRSAASGFTPLPSSLAARALSHNRVVVSVSAAGLAAAKRTSVPETSALGTSCSSLVSQE